MWLMGEVHAGVFGLVHTRVNVTAYRKAMALMLQDGQDFLVDPC